MSGSGRFVSAMAVIDLACQLYQREIITDVDIQEIDGDLLVNVKALLANHDLTALIERQYPETWLVTLWQLADERVPDAPLGVEMGSTISHKSNGLINHLLQSCTNLHEALEGFLKHIALVNAADTWQVHKTAQHLSLTFHFSSEYVYPRNAIERSMIFLYRWSCYYTDKNLPLSAAEFTFDEPNYTELIQQQLHGPVRYGQASNRLIFPLTVLNTPLKSSQPYIKTMLLERAKSLEGNSKIEPRTTDAVLTLLNKDLALYSSQPRVASELCMSRATLGRKLKNEGTNFTQLLSGVRRQYVREYGHLPVKHIVDKLGFADESAYYKAKKKWDELK